MPGRTGVFTSAPAPSRRDVLRAGIGVGAVTIGAATVQLRALLPAAAQSDEPEPLDDGDLAAFVESVELVAVEAYGSARMRELLAGPFAATAAAFASHHAAHAAAWAGASRGKAEGKPNRRLRTVVADQIANASDLDSALEVALDLENAAAATHLYVLGLLKADESLKLAASVLPVESQHAVVVAEALDEPLDRVVPTFENLARGVDPVKFPVATTTTTTTTTTA